MWHHVRKNLLLLLFLCVISCAAQQERDFNITATELYNITSFIFPTLHELQKKASEVKARYIRMNLTSLIFQTSAIKVDLIAVKSPVMLFVDPVQYFLKFTKIHSMCDCTRLSAWRRAFCFPIYPSTIILAQCWCKTLLELATPREERIGRVFGLTNFNACCSLEFVAFWKFTFFRHFWVMKTLWCACNWEMRHYSKNLMCTLRRMWIMWNHCLLVTICNTCVATRIGILARCKQKVHGFQ